MKPEDEDLAMRPFEQGLWVFELVDQRRVAPLKMKGQQGWFSVRVMDLREIPAASVLSRTEAKTAP